MSSRACIRFAFESLFAVALCVPGVRGDDATTRYFDGLLQRGLVSVAEAESLRHLADPLLKPADKTRWTVRLAMALARHAEISGGDERQLLWDRARQTLDNYAAITTAPPRREDLLVARALLEHRRAELMMWEYDICGRGAAARQTALAAATTDAAALQTLVNQLNELARLAGRRTPAQIADGELTPREVRELQREVQLALAAALVNRTELAPDGTERGMLASDAEALLRDLADGWIGEVSTWEARILRARLSRLQRDPEQTADVVQSALRDEPAQWIADRLFAELVRGQLELGRVDEALATLLARGRETSRLSDELIFLQVEAHLAAAQLAKSKRETELEADLRGRAKAWSRQLTGGWLARAELKLNAEREIEDHGPEVVAAVQSARDAYQAGDVQRAADEFGRAADLARGQNRFFSAEEFDYTRASILVSTEDLAGAVAVLDAMRVGPERGPLAADAAALRSYVLGKLYEADPTRTRREAYTAALEVQRFEFDGSTTADDATWRLAGFEERRNQWTRALDLYRTLTDRDAHGSAAQVRMAVLYEQILERLRELQQPPDEWEDRAVEELAAFVRGYRTSTVPLSEMQAEVSVRLVRIVLNHREHPYSNAVELLQPVLDGGAALERSVDREGTALTPAWILWLRTARQLRIVALAGQGDLRTARDEFHELALTDPQQVLELLHGLSDLTESIPADQRKALGHLQLDAVRELRASEHDLSEDDRRAVALLEAEAYEATGNLVDAAAASERLLAESPQDGALLQNAAELLLRLDTPEAAARARPLWLKIEKQSTKGSREWLIARLHVAECLLRTGEADESRKLLGMTRLVYPELGGADLKARYDALELKLKKP
jgi:hypothetical protein